MDADHRFYQLFKGIDAPFIFNESVILQFLHRLDDLLFFEGFSASTDQLISTYDS